MRRRRVRFVAGLSVIVALVVGSVAVAAELQPGGSFLDDDGSIHEGSIEAIAAAAITTGCNPPANDLFCPESFVTRGQMAAFLVRALDLPATVGDPFVDDDDSVFEADIEALAASGITKGCNPPANDWFCAGFYVTRGEMAAFLVRAFELPATTTDYYADDDDSVFETDINALAASGITKGCSGPTYCPDDEVTRAEMASFLTRALGLTPMTPPPRPTTTLPPGTTTTMGECGPTEVHNALEAVIEPGSEFDTEHEALDSEMSSRGIWNSGINISEHVDLGGAYGWAFEEATCSFTT